MNPWAGLMKPLGTRPGTPVRRRLPSGKGAVATTAQGTYKAAAAVVVTDSGIHDRPHVALVPIVAVEFFA